MYATPCGNFPPGQVFDKGIIIQAGQAPAHKHFGKLMQHVSNGDVKRDGVITHRLPLSQAQRTKGSLRLQAPFLGS